MVLLLYFQQSPQQVEVVVEVARMLVPSMMVKQEVLVVAVVRMMVMRADQLLMEMMVEPRLQEISLAVVVVEQELQELLVDHQQLVAPEG